MKQVDKKSTGQVGWGTQVLLVLALGLGIASLGWAVAEKFGEIIDDPAVVTTPAPRGGEPPSFEHSAQR